MASLVSCVSWVNRGVAKSRPDVLKLEKDALERVIAELKTDSTSSHIRASDDDSDEELPHKPAKNATVVKESVKPEADDSEDPYNLDAYDDDEDLDNDANIDLTIAGLTVYADNKDDPYVTIPDEVDDEDDRGDFEIQPSDNLIVAGRAAPECSLLEVYVYNGGDGSLYCHHDIILPAFPLATAWINYDMETKEKGNLVAVGSMEPIISIWDLDVVDVIEPLATLGSKQKKKKKKKKSQESSALAGHTDAILDLAWHSLAPSVLASGSADHTSGIWDLNEGKQLLSLKHSDKVQTLGWHPQESSILLTGAFDHWTRLFDCRQASSSCLKWKVNGEVERVCWDCNNPYNFFASTDSGQVCYMDSRKEKTILYTLQAHDQPTTGLAICQAYADCLATVSMDSTLKIWDTSNNKPSCVYEKTFKQQGGLTCVSTCPDSSSTLVIGSEKSLTVYDINESSAVRKHFVSAKTDVNEDLEMLNKLTISVAESDEEELQEYLGNITEGANENVDPVTAAASNPGVKAKRKKKKAKRKNTNKTTG